MKAREEKLAKAKLGDDKEKKLQEEDKAVGPTPFFLFSTRSQLVQTYTFCFVISPGICESLQASLKLREDRMKAKSSPTKQTVPWPLKAS